MGGIACGDVGWIQLAEAMFQYMEGEQLGTGEFDASRLVLILLYLLAVVLEI
jgi:hypothetical protein